MGSLYEQHARAGTYANCDMSLSGMFSRGLAGACATLPMPRSTWMLHTKQNADNGARGKRGSGAGCMAESIIQINGGMGRPLQGSRKKAARSVVSMG